MSVVIKKIIYLNTNNYKEVYKKDFIVIFLVKKWAQIETPHYY